MSYATYSQYTDVYLGNQISSTNFARLSLRASEIIDKITFSRTAPIVLAGTDIATIALIVKATCAVAEEIQKNEQSGGQDNITSERIGAYQVTFGNKAGAAMTIDEKITKAAALYLGSTGLMYRGFADGEYSGDSDNGEDE